LLHRRPPAPGALRAARHDFRDAVESFPMRRATVIVACALALASCRKSEPAAPPRPRRVVTTVIPEDVSGEKKRVCVKPVPDILDKSALGRDLGPDGAVSREEILFSPGQPVSLTIWLKQSPPGLATGV